MTDGSKSFSIDALTVAGAATFNGAVSLGNATGDDITVTGYVASDILPKNDAQHDLGSASKQWCDLYTKGTTSLDGAVTINESGAAVDFRVEGDTDGNMLFGDASANRIGVGLNDPSAKVEISHNSGSDGYGLIVSTPTGSGDDTGIMIGRYGAGGALIRSSTGVGLQFLYKATIPEFSNAAAITLDSAGKVGIGTTSPDARMVVKSSGNTSSTYALFVRNSSDTTLFSVRDDGIVYGQKGWYDQGIFADSNGSANHLISDASTGTGTETYYIGNAAIQVSSDRRIKENIEPSKLNALETISKFNVVDFTWNDPTDQSYNNRNARGKWTGIIAQEAVNVFPTMVNAPRKESDLSVDFESEDKWHLDSGATIGLFIKAIQEQQELINALRAEVEALKGDK
jgi:hypothetical protein